MATPQPRPTLADYLAIAFSPVLIMALVGSLVYFLLEVFYFGDFLDRLRWILFFYVFAIVLIARISMHDEISPRAILYGLVVGGLTLLALQLYVEYPADLPGGSYSWLINLGLIALSWWCAHKLTWDCTFIDDDEEATGVGLLQASGIESGGVATPPAAPEAATSAQPTYTTVRKKAHTPGVWVVYFSLAALPIYGVGQSLIPVEETARRRFAFWMMVIYVASGLGLLLATAFLGLRRYLRQRKLEMPKAMTGVWLTVGALLIVGLMVVGALLPRPSAEYALFKLPGRLGSHEREASRFAIKGDDPGKGEGASAQDKGKPQGDSPNGNQKDADAKSQTKGQGDGPSKSKGEGKNGSQSDSKGDQQGDNKDSKQGDKKSQSQNKDRPDNRKLQGTARGDKNQEKNDQQKQGDRKDAEKQFAGSQLSFIVAALRLCASVSREACPCRVE